MANRRTYRKRSYGFSVGERIVVGVMALYALSLLGHWMQTFAFIEPKSYIQPIVSQERDISNLEL